MAIEKNLFRSAAVAASTAAAIGAPAAADTLSFQSLKSGEQKNQEQLLDPRLGAVQFLAKVAAHSRVHYLADHKSRPHLEFKGGFGGVDGTGFSQAEINTVKRYGGGSSNFTGNHNFYVTTYGPPWGGIEGGGTTSTGISLSYRKVHEIAVDPSVIPYGSLVDVWPNALDYKGPFLAADTGGAIIGDHVDVFDPFNGGYSTASFNGASVSEFQPEAIAASHKPEPKYRGVLLQTLRAGLQ